MFLTVPIEEGERWKFGEVTIEGNKIYTDQALLRAFKHQARLLAAPEGGRRRRQGDLRPLPQHRLHLRPGGARAGGEARPGRRPGGPRQRGRPVQGRPHRVRGQRPHHGQGAAPRAARSTRAAWSTSARSATACSRSTSSATSSSNEEDPVEIEPDVENKDVDLVFKGEEADRTELQFGGGWSELDGFFGQFAVNTKNFLGRGEQVGVSLQSGRYRDFFDLSYYVPWFLDRPQSIGVRAFNQDLDYRAVRRRTPAARSRNSRGGILTYGRNFRLFQSASISYNRSRYEDRSQITWPEPHRAIRRGRPIQAGRHRHVPYDIDNSSLRPVYVIDSRDNPFEPTRGQRFSLAAEYAGGFLGGDNYFIRPELAYSLFLPIEQLPGAAGVRAQRRGRPGRAVRRDQYELSPLERFYLGGENSIRGHRFRSIYLRKPNGDPAARSENRRHPGRRQLHPGQPGVPFPARRPVPRARVRRRRQRLRRGASRSTCRACATPRAPSCACCVPVFGAPLRFIYAVNLDEQPERQLRGLPVQHRHQLLTPRRRDNVVHVQPYSPQPSWGSPWRPASILRRFAAPRAGCRRRGGIKIAVIDTERILLDVETGKKALADLKKLQEAKEAEVTRQAAGDQGPADQDQRRPAVARPGQARPRWRSSSRTRSSRLRRFQDDANARAQQEAGRGPRRRSTRR